VQSKPYSDVHAIFTGLCSSQIELEEKFSILKRVVGNHYKKLCVDVVPLWMLFSRNIDCSLLQKILLKTNQKHVSASNINECYSSLPSEVFSIDRYSLAPVRTPFSRYAHPEISSDNVFLQNSFIHLTEENCKELYDFDYIEKTIMSRVIDYIVSQNTMEN
jgi:hypothetical protein